MNWFLLALAAPLAWSVANYIDKYLLSRSKSEGQGGSGGLMILSSLASLCVVALVFMFKGSAGLSLHPQQIAILIFSGCLEALYILFYFWALERSSTSTVISLFQFAPIAGLIFGYFLLREVATGIQLFSVGLILVGTLCILLKKRERFSRSGTVFCLMLVSTIFVGLYNTLFKLAGETTPFWTAVFWQYVGIVVVGIILFLVVPKYRMEAFQMLRHQGRGVLALTGLAEAMNIVAVLAINAAVLLAPVALVLAVSSMQPLFVFFEGLIIFALFPKLLDASERPSLKVQYLVGIVLVCIGGFFIY